jgi:sarcosine oxidase
MCVAISEQNRFDVIVVGAGLMGAATAWSLSRRGRSVLVVERYKPAHAGGSSHGSARIVRRAYADALYTRLSGRAFELWRELEQRSGAKLLRMLGGIDSGAHGAIAAVAGSLSTSGVAYELMSAAEAEQRWPGMCFEGEVVFHPQAGTVDAEKAVEAFLADAGGAELMTDAEVVRIQPGADGVAIELAGGGQLAGRAVVVAAGGWAAPLLDGAVTLPPLAVTQQQVFHFPRVDIAAAPWPSAIDQSALIYHLAGGRDGGVADDRKVAEHRHGTLTTASARDGVIEPGSRSRIVEYVKRWLPGLDPTPRGEATCLYTTTPSEDFILDRVGPVVVCSACSGHGAKFAPLAGELAADLATEPARARVPPRFRLSSHRST